MDPDDRGIAETWNSECCEVKKSINNILWSLLPSDTTLGEAEQIAVAGFVAMQTEIEAIARKSEP